MNKEDFKDFFGEQATYHSLSRDQLIAIKQVKMLETIKNVLINRRVIEAEEICVPGKTYTFSFSSEEYDSVTVLVEENLNKGMIIKGSLLNYEHGSGNVFRAPHPKKEVVVNLNKVQFVEELPSTRVIRD